MSHPESFAHLPLNSSSLAFVEELYEDYLVNPGSVEPEWQEFFRDFSDENGISSNFRTDPHFQPRSIFHPIGTTQGGQSLLQERLDQLIRNYRVRGHIVARVDPLDQPRPDPPELHAEMYKIGPEDYGQPISSSALGGTDVATVREILERLQNTYCRYIGVQYMHIDSLFVRSWLQERMESSENRINMTRRLQLRILKRLTDAVVFESFLQKKYVGAKSFSLEGAETLIPLLDLAIEKAGADGLEDIVIGMAHRGRLNVLTNIMGKRPRDIFREFEDIDPERNLGRGDVKYHMGFSSDWTTLSGQTIHLSLCFNPSHLEFVNTVAIGKCRAKQDRLQDRQRRRAMTILIHGDSAFAGEGIVQETLNLSELKGYKTGGTIHVIVNNQIGFTTGPAEGRSSIYATDVAKLLQIPIFHVNGEDPEAVAQVIHLAMDFRKKFQRDVVIDMYCYRLRGHNEGDEPEFTQPVMYRAIKKRKSVRESYLDHLLKMDGMSAEEADEIEREAQGELEEELEAARADDYEYQDHHYQGIWEDYRGGPDVETPDIDTGEDRQLMVQVLESLTTVPDDFTPHPKLRRLLDSRRAMSTGEEPLDWATAELLAFGTLARQGVRVRLSGQDCRRGTFSQRHSVMYDHQDGHTYHLLQHLSEDQAKVEIINSPLSEAGVLGFDYGYSLDYPDGLVIWEAQFGDFHNTAQVIIDQFLSSAEDKWHRLSGIVLMLPHGFAGQGPEHSSARLERFLTLSAEDNMQVVYATTPAQHFHCLRRQVLRPWRKPLVLMTPKSLLRHPRAVSTLDECETGGFQRIIPDSLVDPAGVTRVLLCSGKVYYDLLERRENNDRNDVAILRLEQLYPLRDDELFEILEPYPESARLIWVQEEPENMGAWCYLFCHFRGQVMDRWPLELVSRPASASPATGSAHSHKIEQAAVVRAAFQS